MTGRAGIVYLVGAGPGDPGLLTLRGAELLVGCDAIVYDALANPALLALASVQDRAEPVELHDVGKRGGSNESARQAEITDLLVKLASEGKRVVRLKGGDPFVFGRGSEEAQALAEAGIEFEVVPGVTAGIAAPAYAGIPVTHRGLSTSVTFVTGHEDPGKDATTVDWSALARAGGTIVLYMGVKTLPRTVRALVAGGMPADTPAAAVQWGTYAAQRTVVATLSTLADAIASRRTVRAGHHDHRAGGSLARRDRLVRSTAAVRPANCRDPRGITGGVALRPPLVRRGRCHRDARDAH